MTTVLVFTEGGPQVGLGHIRRCITLASALERDGIESNFRVAGGNDAERVVEAAGFDVAPLGDPANAREIGTIVKAAAAEGVVIDSYAPREDVFYACAARKTIVMDDLADRKLPVDLVVNSTIAGERLDYGPLTRARLLLGPKYALLRPEFAGGAARVINANVGRIMVTLGGSDHGSLARDVVRWCLADAPDAVIEVVVGPFFEHTAELQAQANGGSRIMILERPNMRDVMMRADLAVSSGGQTLFEIAATGLPAIIIATADNQLPNVAGFAEAGIIRNAGRHDDRELRAQFDAAFDAVRDAGVRRRMSDRGPRLVDGRGAERVASEVATLLRNTRSATA